MRPPRRLRILGASHLWGLIVILGAGLVAAPVEAEGLGGEGNEDGVGAKRVDRRAGVVLDELKVARGVEVDGPLAELHDDECAEVPVWLEGGREGKEGRGGGMRVGSGGWVRVSEKST